jgi:hypothetical protein
MMTPPGSENEGKYVHKYDKFEESLTQESKVVEVVCKTPSIFKR